MIEQGASRDKACIAGNVPISPLTVGTPDDVQEYCRNVKAMVDSTRQW
jgi:hypothetical protein